jgi:outer membrane protein
MPRLNSAAANLRSSKGDYWPSLAAQANYNDYDTDLSLYKDSWEVGMVESWVLFSGLQTKGAEEEAQGKFMENRAQLEDLHLAVVREVTERYLSAAENKERLKIVLETLELARENLALAKKRYESGANDVIEFNDAQLSLTRTRNDIVVTYYGYLTALGGIELPAVDRIVSSLRFTTFRKLSLQSGINCRLLALGCGAMFCY